jgi:diguanylate cyclase (GGDEF)-like protein/PAS domain S-box-containing protein
MNPWRPRWRRLDADFTGTPLLPQMPWYLMGIVGGLVGAGLCALLNLAAPGMLPVAWSGLVLGCAIAVGEPSIIRWFGRGDFNDRGIWCHYVLAFTLFALLLNPMGIGFLLPATTVMVAAVHVHWSGARAAPPMLVAATAAAAVNHLLLVLGLTDSLLDTGPAFVATVIALIAALVSVANLHATATRKEMAGRDLGRAERRFRTLVQNSSDVVTTLDRSGRFTYLSPAVTAVIGLEPDQLLDRPAALLVAPGSRPEFMARLHEVVRDASAVSRWEARSDVETAGWLEFSATNLLDDAAIEGVVLHLRDVTERREFADQLAHSADHDALTGLKSRSAFLRRAEVMLAAASPDAQVAVLFCDLDGFKLINDTHGHAAGDRVLVAVADRLRRALRPQDLLGRIGGDEFTVVLPAVDPAAAEQVVARLTALVTEPVEVGEEGEGRQVRVGASIGLTLVQLPEPADEVLRAADQAMYRIKSARRVPAAREPAPPPR